jgi:hypothetical protein
MTTEQMLLEKWRSLPPNKQQEVFNFVNFLHSTNVPITENKVDLQSRLDFAEKLDQLRQEIIDSGIPLLTDEEVYKEIAERRGGYQETE